MPKKITVRTNYGSKKDFQKAGETAWITVETRDNKGQLQDKQVQLSQVLNGDIIVEVRNGEPVSCPGGVSPKEAGTTDPLSPCQGQKQPSWVAKVFRDGSSVRIM